MNIKRRKFLKKSTLTLGAFGVQSAGIYGGTRSELPPDPDPALQDEELYLWPDGSENNGTNPNYRPKIKIYYPTTRNKEISRKFAAVLICPGGGYNIQAAHEGQPFARLFALHGIVGVVLTYRVNPDRFPGPYDDACRAMRILRKNAYQYNIDPERLGIMGFSAGGHLASTVATQPELHLDRNDDLSGVISARPDKLILGYPVISLVDDFAHHGSAKSLLGQDPDQTMLNKLSNNHQVTDNNPPAFLFHTADDQGVPVENSISFAQACIRNRVPVELHVYQEGKHGVGMALEDPALKSWPGLLMDWLTSWTIN